MKFRKKPVVVDAMQFIGNNGDDVVEWAKSLGANDAIFWNTSNTTGCVGIRTLEGTMHASPGDWIIRGTAGEFYPCKDAIFQAIYDLEKE
jgi:hypothetical protein